MNELLGNPRAGRADQKSALKSVESVAAINTIAIKQLRCFLRT
jgi:hypothetical protein